MSYNFTGSQCEPKKGPFLHAVVTLKTPKKNREQQAIDNLGCMSPWKIHLGIHWKSKSIFFGGGHDREGSCEIPSMKLTVCTLKLMVGRLLGCPRKLVNGSWISYNLFVNGVYWGYNPLIPTFDPNFQRDIQVGMAYFHRCSLAVSFRECRTWAASHPRIPLTKPLATIRSCGLQVKVWHSNHLPCKF